MRLQQGRELFEYGCAFCYRGHAEGIALEKEGCFVLQDLRGRDWFCFESNIPSLAGVDREALIQEKAAEMSQRIQRLWERAAEQRREQIDYARRTVEALDEMAKAQQEEKDQIG